MNTVETATKILDTMLGHLGLPASLEVQETHDGPCLQIHSTEHKAIIGRDGERLDDLQYLVNRILRRQFPKAERIKVDCEHYRTIREDQMAAEIKEIAERVKRTGTPYQMRPLNAYYRRMVHHILVGDPEIQTHSPEGEERLKRITISAKSTTLHLMKKFLFDCGTRDATASFGIFALRVMVALMMLLGHGIPKLLNYGALKDGFYVPDFFPFYFLAPPVTLMLAIVAEVVVPLLLIVGLMTRPAAFVLGFNMVVAVFGAMAGTPWFISPPTVLMAKELGLLYLIPMMVIIFTGAGTISLDAGLFRDSKRRRW